MSGGDIGKGIAEAVLFLGCASIVGAASFVACVFWLMFSFAFTIGMIAFSPVWAFILIPLSFILAMAVWIKNH